MQQAVLGIVNKGKDTMIFKPGEMIGIIDVRSLGYYKIKQGILQQNLNRYYRFERAEKLCEYFNKFVNTLKKEREQELPEDRFVNSQICEYIEKGKRTRITRRQVPMFRPGR